MLKHESDGFILATDERFFFSCIGDAQQVHRPKVKEEELWRRDLQLLNENIAENAEEEKIAYKISIGRS
ncbi:MAG: hypothetical protein IJU76_13805 [Desulfovibrionaceae bacterium]|nr:hypothetical protein [Desulfovibrionaceae bacterium]